MRILHVVRGLANSSGTTHIVGPLAEAQARSGHSVEVMCIEKIGQEAIVPDPALVATHEFPMTVPSVHFGWSRPFGRAIKEAVRRVDIVHIHAIWNYATWSTMRACCRAGVPYLVAPQGSLSNWALGRSRHLKRLYATLLEKPLFDRAAAVQAVTPAEADECQRFGIRAPPVIIPNGVDRKLAEVEGARADLRQELGLEANALLFLFVGRLFPKKGLDLLIPAFGRLAEQRSETHLLIAGHDGGSGYRKQLEAWAADTCHAGRIHFLGELRDERKFEVMRGANVFVLTSYSEGLPVAVLEAMGCGLPVVITAGCNLPQVFEREAGWEVNLTEAGIQGGLTAASIDVHERSERGSNARKLVLNHFTWDSISTLSLDFYKSLS